MNNPLIWMLIIFFLVFLVYALRAFFGYRVVARDAIEDYDYKLDKGMVDPRIGREGYIRAYKRLHNPRRLMWIAITLALIMVLTFPALIFLRHLFEFLYQLSGRSRAIEPGYLVWQMMTFFGMIAIYALIGYFCARQYHRRAPAGWLHEMEKEKKEIEEF